MVDIIAVTCSLNCRFLMWTKINILKRKSHISLGILPEGGKMKYGTLKDEQKASMSKLLLPGSKTDNSAWEVLIHEQNLIKLKADFHRIRMVDIHYSQLHPSHMSSNKTWTIINNIKQTNFRISLFFQCWWGERKGLIKKKKRRGFMTTRAQAHAS